MSCALLSEHDRFSFLVPCYGFNNPAQAEAYLSSGKSSSPSFEPVYARHKAYVPRGHLVSDDFSTNWLEERCPTKPMWKMLRRQSTPKPDGAFNAALLIKGRRQFSQSPRRTAQRPKWWYSLADGLRDCYVAWSQPGSEKKFYPVLGSKETGGRAYAARWGRIVLYARTMSYGNDGSPEGLRVTCIRLEFSIFDRDPAKDDILQVKFAGHSRTYPTSPEVFSEPFGSENLDADWQALIEKAQRGFEEICQPVPPEIEKWRQHFLDQRQKERADRQKSFGQTFEDLTAQLDWQEALRRVREPWQLKIVAARHGRRPEFSKDGGVYTIPYETVPTMITRHDCDETRREELRHMVASYVEPSDDLWSYRGD